MFLAPLSGHSIQDGASGEHYQAHSFKWLQGLGTKPDKGGMSQDKEGSSFIAPSHHSLQEDCSPTHKPGGFCIAPFSSQGHLCTSFPTSSSIELC